jgi:hypothetical protein
MTSVDTVREYRFGRWVVAVSRRYDGYSWWGREWNALISGHQLIVDLGYVSLYLFGPRRGHLKQYQGER